MYMNKIFNLFQRKNNLFMYINTLGSGKISKREPVPEAST